MYWTKKNYYVEMFCEEKKHMNIQKILKIKSRRKESKISKVLQKKN